MIDIAFQRQYLSKVRNFLGYGRSQAVRLPKEYQFSRKDVLVQKVGDVEILFSNQDVD